MFSNDKYKGTKGYLKSQRIYELIRTILYFSISLTLFFAGWFATGNRMNLLTVVAILGCLPASKSLVETIIFFRFKGLDLKTANELEQNAEGLNGLFDLAFTSYERNYEIKHLVVKGNTICGYTDMKKFDEQEFYKHLDSRLRIDNFKNTTAKIFTDKKKYIERLSQLKQLSTEEENTAGIIATIKSITL